MLRTLKTVMRQDKEKFKIPKSVQQAIPIQTIWKDGIFLVGKNKYAKTYRLQTLTLKWRLRKIRKRCFWSIPISLTSLTAERPPS